MKPKSLTECIRFKKCFISQSLLVKDGHIPTDPRDFLNSEGSESAHQLLVVIKNEDVISCINKVIKGFV